MQHPVREKQRPGRSSVESNVPSGVGRVVAFRSSSLTSEVNRCCTLQVHLRPAARVSEKPRCSWRGRAAASQKQAPSGRLARTRCAPSLLPLASFLLVPLRHQTDQTAKPADRCSLFRLRATTVQPRGCRLSCAPAGTAQYAQRRGSARPQQGTLAGRFRSRQLARPKRPRPLP